MAVISGADQNAVAASLLRSAAYIGLEARDASTEFVWNASNNAVDSETAHLEWALWADGEPYVSATSTGG